MDFLPGHPNLLKYNFSLRKSKTEIRLKSKNKISNIKISLLLNTITD